MVDIQGRVPTLRLDNRVARPTTLAFNRPFALLPFVPVGAEPAR